MSYGGRSSYSGKRKAIDYSSDEKRDFQSKRKFARVKPLKAGYALENQNFDPTPRIGRSSYSGKRKAIDYSSDEKRVGGGYYFPSACSPLIPVEKEPLEAKDNYNQSLFDLEDVKYNHRNGWGGGTPRVVGPLNEDDELYHSLCRYSKLTIEKYNHDNDTNYDFVKYVKATKTSVIGSYYHITFEAMEPSDDAPTTFQAVVYNGIRAPIIVRLVRKKPYHAED